VAELQRALLAQDPFEIHVYGYEPMEWGEFSLETHLNFDPQGTKAAEGTLLPARNQTHLTLEPTIGLAPEFALGFMFLSAWEPGNSRQYAGWRVLPHFYAPESWNLPVKLGFIAEFSFQNTQYEETAGVRSCGRLSTACLNIGRSCSIRCSNARYMAQEPGTDGISNLQGW
jgi:hypothetical protein